MTVALGLTTVGRQSAPVEAAHTLEAALDQLFTLRHVAATEVLLVRHGESDFEDAGHCEQPRDLPLSANGREQAMLLAVRLQGAGIDAVYSSPARCALETAAYLTAPHGLPISRCSDLRDVSVQLDDPASAAGGVSTERDIVRQLVAEPRWDSLPGLEPSRSFRHRAIAAVEGIVARHDVERVAIVTHSSVINAYLSMTLGIARDVFFLPAHASISVARSAGDLYAVTCLNDVAHIAEPLRSY